MVYQQAIHTCSCENHNLQGTHRKRLGRESERDWRERDIKRLGREKMERYRKRLGSERLERDRKRLEREKLERCIGRQIERERLGS